MENPSPTTPANEADLKPEAPKVESKASDDEDEGIEQGCDDHPDIAEKYLPLTETNHWFWKRTWFNSSTQAERDAHLMEFRNARIEKRAREEAAEAAASTTMSSPPPSTVATSCSSSSSSSSSVGAEFLSESSSSSPPAAVTFSPMLTQGDFPPPVASPLAGAAQPESPNSKKTCVA